jgi:cytidine deaminase
MFADRMSELSEAAWRVRANARVLGATPVGCAALGADASIWAGCNVEHRYRSHDIHAETNAIATMVAAGETRLVGIVVAAERERFSPCGACLDWVFEFGGGECLVGWQSNPHADATVLYASDLMPYYPR